MPRERVQHGKYFLWPEGQDMVPGELPGVSGREWIPGMEQPEGTIIREEPSIDISWNRMGWVQLSIEGTSFWWEQFIESFKGSPETTHMAAHSEVLSRDQINHMIRTLRRARDAAYGADA